MPNNNKLMATAGLRRVLATALLGALLILAGCSSGSGGSSPEPLPDGNNEVPEGGGGNDLVPDDGTGDDGTGDDGSGGDGTGDDDSAGGGDTTDSGGETPGDSTDDGSGDATAPAEGDVDSGSEMPGESSGDDGGADTTSPSDGDADSGDESAGDGAGDDGGDTTAPSEDDTTSEVEDELNSELQALLDEVKALEARVAEIDERIVPLRDDDLLAVGKHVELVYEDFGGPITYPTIRFSGVNLKLVANWITGTGNLIIGYNEGAAETTGRETLVVGEQNSYTRTAGTVAGKGHRLAVHRSSILGGQGNEIDGQNNVGAASIIGGYGHRITEVPDWAVVVGGSHNTTRSHYGSIRGGQYGTIVADTIAQTILGGHTVTLPSDAYATMPVIAPE